MTRVRPPRAADSRRPVLGFLARCLGYWAVALLVLGRVPQVETAGIAVTVVTVARLFGLMGRHIVRQGNSLFVDGRGVSVVGDCSPHVAFLIYAAVVLAFPSNWRQRGLGLLFGAVVIMIFNTARIALLIQTLIWRPDWFEFAHVYLWQTGTVFVLFATFALWLRWVGPARPAVRARA